VKNFAKFEDLPAPMEGREPGHAAGGGVSPEGCGLFGRQSNPCTAIMMAAMATTKPASVNMA
jgi:hypothetical protein